MVKVYGVKLIDDTRFLEMKGLMQACLPHEVCVAASAFRHMAVMQRKVLGELLLRALVNRDHNVSSHEIRIAYNAKKKPYLESHPHIHFNISHSGQWVVIAFSDKQVGVDVEKIRNVNLNVAKRFFSEDEKNRLFSLPAKHQLPYFFDLWTLKESFLKAIGTGLTRPLKSFTILQSSGGFELDSAGEYQEATLGQIPLARDYKLSVCSFEKEIDKRFTPLFINDLLELMNTES